MHAHSPCEKLLILSGRNLNVVPGKADYRVTIGGDGDCVVTRVTLSTLDCRPPDEEPTAGANVSIRNGKVMLSVKVCCLILICKYYD